VTTLAVQNGFPFSKREWIWPVAVAELIFLASSRSQMGGPSVSESDKVVHFAGFGLLATLVVHLGRGSRAAWLSVVLVSAHGILNECYQSFTRGRSVELADWMADTGGAALAVVIYAGWTWYRNFWRRRFFAQRRVENTATASTDSLS
jgi:VanZ family protein